MPPLVALLMLFAGPAAMAVPYPASSMFEQVVAHKLEVAAATAALARDPNQQRVPLRDYLVLLQRDTCAGTFGDLTRGQGAECMAASVPSDLADASEDEEVQLCASQGGVLIKRMHACSDASATLALSSAAQADAEDFDTMMRAYTEVARHCWGRTLCVE